MRKKLALLFALSISAIFAGSAYSTILYANQYSEAGISSSYTVSGASYNTTTYDFSTGAGVDRWAYRIDVSQNPPPTNSVPSTEFNTVQYSRISSDDGVFQVERASMWNYASHRFVFHIYQNNITLLHIVWNGIGRHDILTDGLTFYIWNHTGASYEVLDSTNSYPEVYLEANISSGVNNYIDGSGNLTLLAVQNSPSFRFFWNFYSRLATDYVKVDVTYMV